MVLGYRKKFDACAILEQIAATYLGSKITTTVKGLELNPNVEIATTSTANTLVGSAVDLGLHHASLDAEALAANAIGSTLGNELSARIPNQQPAAEHVVDADIRSLQRATAQPSRHQAHTQHQSAHPATHQRPASATPAYDAASDPMTLADEVTTFSQLYHQAHTETVTPQSAPATRAERWNNTAKKDWRSLINDMPFSVRLAAGFTSPMEKITAAISLAKGMYNEAMGVAHGLYEVGAVISHVKLSNIHLVHSLSDYTSNLKNTTKLAFTSVGDSLLSIANKNYTMLTSSSPAIAGYAAGQLAGDAIIAYAAPKGLNLAAKTLKNIGGRTFGMFGRTVETGKGRILSTGGRQIESVNAWNQAEKDAALFYERIRNNPSNSDVMIIAKNSGMLEFQVQRIKQHLFHDTHILDTGVGRFAPDIEIADAWTRLQNGNFVKEDLQLLQHEYYEARFKGIFKTDYITAHKASNRSGRIWDPERFITKPEMHWRP